MPRAGGDDGRAGVRGTANSGKSGYLSTHVAGEGCEPWGKGRDPRAEASGN